MKKIVLTCLNPDCGKKFTPGHYGDRQKVGTGKDHLFDARCPTCKGAGKRRGERCFRCRGKKTIRQTCQEWYRGYWAQTRKRPRGVAPDALKRILAVAREDTLWWSLFTVAAWSAMRKGELLGLSWSDVLGDRGKVLATFPLRGQWDDRKGFQSTKTDSGRNAFLLEPARKALTVFLVEVKENGWKPSDRIWPVWEKEAWEKFVQIQKGLKIVNPDTGHAHRFHDLRHRAVLAVYQSTRDLKKAQELAGHKSIATTGIYAQERPEEFVADLDKQMKGNR